MQNLRAPREFGEGKSGVLFQIIERFIARHECGLIKLDEHSFKLFELAKRALIANTEAGLQGVLQDIHSIDLKKRLSTAE